MPKQISNELLSWPVELLRIAPPPECENLSSADWDTLKRNHPDKVVKISRRRRGACCLPAGLRQLEFDL